MTYFALITSFMMKREEKRMEWRRGEIKMRIYQMTDPERKNVPLNMVQNVCREFRALIRLDWRGEEREEGRLLDCPCMPLLMAHSILDSQLRVMVMIIFYSGIHTSVCVCEREEEFFSSVTVKRSFREYQTTYSSPTSLWQFGGCIFIVCLWRVEEKYKKRRERGQIHSMNPSAIIMMSLRIFWCPHEQVT